MDTTPSQLPTDHPLLMLLEHHDRVLLLGAPGSGKTTLARAVAAHLAEQGRACRCLAADPGLPGFGPPGAVCLGVWRDGDWQLESIAALATLDSARFRLPLVEAVARLAERVDSGPLLIDAPGVIRGTPGAELLPALARAAHAEALALLSASEGEGPLAAERAALGLAEITLAPAPEARHPGKRVRLERRSAIWEAWLAEAAEYRLDLAPLAVTGAPPPRHAPEAWRGRQVGLLDARGDTLALGEVVALEGEYLRLRSRAPAKPPATLVIRDARRRPDERLGTAPPHRPPAASHRTLPEADVPFIVSDAPRPRVDLGTATATLVNGVFGDPLLHLRLKHQRRSLLFDLGDPGRLSARLAHQVSDLFISHAHFDHIGGFLWLLRSRIGDFAPCRVYGPPGLASHLDGMMRGVLWDRVGDKAPRFEVGELHGDRLARWQLTAGGPEPLPLPSRPVADGVLHAELGFRIRAATLDHGTPVLAFAYEPDTQVRVRKERLAARGWPPGPWLGALKRAVLAGEETTRITLPSGERRSAASLAGELLLREPGQRLVYATDLGDTAENRRRLVALARGARALFCEAPFREREADQARRTGHLTARACGEIAAAAGVDQLVPFHFSRRHVSESRHLYAEITPHFPYLVPTSDAAG
ncbi:MAG: MBL fold metallo-hydrolase [Halomonas sp.]